MSEWTRKLVGGFGVMFLVMSASPTAATDPEEDPFGDALAHGQATMRVRTSSSTISGLIQQAAVRSTTFQRVMAELANTDGIVYVERGKCPHGVRACLLMEMAISGSNRLLYILVDTRRQDTELMAAIGHELRHALEVLSNRTLKTGTAIYFFYRLTATSLGRGMFETPAAVETGEAVRAQLRSSPSP